MIRYLLVLSVLMLAGGNFGRCEEPAVTSSEQSGEAVLAGTRWSVSWDQHATWELFFRADRTLVVSWINQQRVNRDDNFSEHTYTIKSQESGKWQVADGVVLFEFVHPRMKNIDRVAKTSIPVVYKCRAAASARVMSGEFIEGSGDLKTWKAVVFSTAPAVDRPKPLPFLTVRPGRPLGVSVELEIEATVAADGTVLATRVIKSDKKRMNRYFQKAVENWRFLPAISGGKPIESKTVLSFSFKS